MSSSRSKANRNGKKKKKKKIKVSDTPHYTQLNMTQPGHVERHRCVSKVVGQLQASPNHLASSLIQPRRPPPLHHLCVQIEEH